MLNDFLCSLKRAAWIEYNPFILSKGGTNECQKNSKRQL